MKNIFYFIFVVLIAVLGLISCKKNHTVRIKAINAVTGQPYAGLSYSIKGTKTGSDGEKLVFTHSGTLNSNGEASPNIKVNENLTLHVGCDPPPNYCYQKNINFFWDAKTDPSPSFQFEYAECANLKLEINNINCQGPTDEIKFRRLWLHQNATNNFVTQTGCFSFTGEFFQLPIGNYKYEWEVTRNGSTTYHDSLFTLAENQFFTFVLNY